MKADLLAQYLCRLYRHMDANGLGVAVAHDRHGCQVEDETIFGGLSAGYVMRTADRLPRQGRDAPWRVTHHYPTDRRQLLDEPIVDSVLSFEAARPAQTANGRDDCAPSLLAA